VLAIAIALTVGETACARGYAGVGSWSPTGAMPQGWTGGSAVTLTGGSVLAVAGASAGAATSTDLYDPHRGTWATPPDLPSPASFSTAVALSDGGALLVGGATCNDVERRCLPTASTYRLNPSDSEWVPTASMLVARVNPIVVRLAGGRVLVAGGFGDNCPAIVAGGYSCRPLASAEVYDPVKDRWSMARGCRDRLYSRAQRSRADHTWSWRRGASSAFPSSAPRTPRAAAWGTHDSNSKHNHLEQTPEAT
jgi:hypothetical protein